jgi:hypothetical protein
MYRKPYTNPQPTDLGEPMLMALRIVYHGNKINMFPTQRSRTTPPKDIRDLITRDFGALGLSPAKAVSTFVGQREGVVDMFWETKSKSVRDLCVVLRYLLTCVWLSNSSVCKGWPWTSYAVRKQPILKVALCESLPSGFQRLG